MLYATRDRVIIEVDKPEEKTEGGLYKAPSTQDQERSGRGTVISAGEDSDARRGDVVFFHEFAGVEIKYQGNTYLAMKSEDVLAMEGPE